MCHGKCIPLVFWNGTVYGPKYARSPLCRRFIKNWNQREIFQGVIVWTLRNISVSLWVLKLYFEIDMVFGRATIGEIWRNLSILASPPHASLIQLYLLCCGLNPTVRQGSYRSNRHILLFRFEQNIFFAPKNQVFSSHMVRCFIWNIQSRGLSPQETGAAAYEEWPWGNIRRSLPFSKKLNKRAKEGIWTCDSQMTEQMLTPILGGLVLVLQKE